MLTHPEKTTERPPADVDTTPALRRLASGRGINWGLAVLLLCGPGALLLLALLLAPVLALALAVGLAGTCARYVIRRDWSALRHISAGLGLVVVGYITARAGHHAGLPTLTGWAEHVRGVDNPNIAALGVSLLARAVYFAGLLGLLVGSAYALIRPYRTRFSRPTVLAACVMLGAMIGFVG